MSATDGLDDSTKLLFNTILTEVRETRKEGQANHEAQQKADAEFDKKLAVIAAETKSHRAHCDERFERVEKQTGANSEEIGVIRAAVATNPANSNRPRRDVDWMAEANNFVKRASAVMIIVGTVAVIVGGIVKLIHEIAKGPILP